MVYAVIRVRGTVNIKPDIKKTMQLLRLTRANHCVLLEENEVYKGMLQIVKDYTTWGEINKETLTKLFCTGKLLAISPSPVFEKNALHTFENSQKPLENKVKYKELQVETHFQTQPPKKGHQTIKRRL
jgi:large subunit ribosomal protein L30